MDSSFNWFSSVGGDIAEMKRQCLNWTYLLDSGVNLGSKSWLQHRVKLKVDSSVHSSPNPRIHKPWYQVLIRNFLYWCLTLCNSMACNSAGFSVCGIFQARILEWVAISYSRGSSGPRDSNHVSGVSCIAGGFFTFRTRCFYCWGYLQFLLGELRSFKPFGSAKKNK